jgi:hypothetical protein
MRNILKIMVIGELPKRRGFGRKRTKVMRRQRRDWRKKKAVYEFVESEVMKLPVMNFLSRWL